MTKLIALNDKVPPPSDFIYDDLVPDVSWTQNRVQFRYQTNNQPFRFRYLYPYSCLSVGLLQ